MDAILILSQLSPEGAVKVGIISGVIGFVYVTILTRPGHVLSWWANLIYRTYDKIFTPNSEKWAKYLWILDPIVECELCVSGQIALWTLIFPVLLYITIPIFAICLSILLAKVLNKATN